MGLLHPVINLSVLTQNQSETTKLLKPELNILKVYSAKPYRRDDL